jgi:hypothetical protein
MSVGASPTPAPAPAGIAARAFCRSLNILLKNVRLYGFAHKRSTDQFDIMMRELRAALKISEHGLLLGVAGGEKLLVDGSPIEVGPAERSFVQMLAAAGIASMQFNPQVSDAEMLDLSRAFSMYKPAEFVDKAQKAGIFSGHVQVNAVRFVVDEEANENSSVVPTELASSVLGVNEKFSDWLRDPKKLLQLIMASEGAGGSSGSAVQDEKKALIDCIRGLWQQTSEAPAGTGNGTGSGSGSGDGAGSGNGSGPGNGTGNSEATPVAKDAEAAEWQEVVSEVARDMFADGQDIKPDDLVRLAEQAAIRLALRRYERGDVEVNTVHQLMTRMSKQIANLKKVLGDREKQMAGAGMMVENYASVLDRQFWAEVPERSKINVLTSKEAFCVPARNIATYVNELLARGDEKLAFSILRNYVGLLPSDDSDAVRRIATGISELTELLRKAGVLSMAISRLGQQLARTNDFETESLLSASFVRLSHEAATNRRYEEVQEVLASMQQLEKASPAIARDLRPRVTVEHRFREFIQDAVTSANLPQGLVPVLGLNAPIATRELVGRFANSTTVGETDRIVEIISLLGEKAIDTLRVNLETATPIEAVLTIGLLSRLDHRTLRTTLPRNLRKWSRQLQREAVRQIALGSAPVRGLLLCDMLPAVDPLVMPQVLDEIGFSAGGFNTDPLITLAQDPEANPYARVKAIEALGRLRENTAYDVLRGIVTSRRLFRWEAPQELRIVALHALSQINPDIRNDREVKAGFDSAELRAGALEVKPGQWLRHRRYPRATPSKPLLATTEIGQKPSRLNVHTLSLGGGAAQREKTLSGGEGQLQLAVGPLRRVECQVTVKPLAGQDVAFEIVDIDLEHRRLLRDVLAQQLSDHPEV